MRARNAGSVLFCVDKHFILVNPRCGNGHSYKYSGSSELRPPMELPGCGVLKVEGDLILEAHGYAEVSFDTDSAGLVLECGLNLEVVLRRGSTYQKTSHFNCQDASFKGVWTKYIEQANIN